MPIFLPPLLNDDSHKSRNGSKALSRGVTGIDKMTPHDKWMIDMMTGENVVCAIMHF